MKYLLALLLIVPGVIYAEESIVQVPFDYHGQSCHFDELAVEYHCTWQGEVDPMTVEEIEAFRTETNSRMIDEAIAELNEQAITQIKIEQAKLTPTEIKIQRLQEKYDRGNITSNEIEYLKLLKNLDQCYNGLGKSRQIQDYRAFETSTEQTSFLQGHDFKGYFGKLAKAIEECKAQHTLENNLSAQYDHIIGPEVIQLHHRDFVGDTQAVPFDKLTATNKSINLGEICSNYKFTDSHKKQYGCVIEYDGYTLDKTSGMMTIESEILSKYWEFRDSMYYRNE